MAAGSGLLLLAVAVTTLHFVVIFGFGPVAWRLTNRLGGTVHLHVTYQDAAFCGSSSAPAKGMAGRSHRS